MESTNLHQSLEWLKSADPSLTYKPLHSRDQTVVDFARPHSCIYCQQAVVNGEDFAEKPLIDRGEGRYFRETTFSCEVGRSLEEAIQASKAGCALYQWLLDTLVDNLKNLHPGDYISQISFGLEFDTDDDEISCGPLINGSFEDGTKFRPASASAFQRGSWSRLDVCAHEGDSSSKAISQRPPESDMFSARSIQFGKDCLATCLEHHEHCRTEWLKADCGREGQGMYPYYSQGTTKLSSEVIALEYLPTRLLRIETSTDGALLVKLVEVTKLPALGQENIASAGFTALSYCWGREGNPIQLTSQTYKSLKQGLAAASLPATIYDAICYAKVLSLEYIWVDALCIFQDDVHDKEVEIMRMGAYYGANTLTLCAASADGSSKGLRNSAPRSLYRVPPIALACKVGEDVGRIILHSKLEARECITERGWTLQESLLSRRMLIFSHQLYWCCVSADAECEGTRAKLPITANRNFGPPESLVPGIFPAEILKDYPPKEQWYLGVQDFSKRHLGVASDKLLAISAFASWVRDRFRVRDGDVGESVTYVAGMFLSTRDTDSLVRQLFWRPPKTASCSRPTAYRAPSWSWAAVDGELELRDGRFTGDTCFIFEAFDLKLTHDSAPYGSVKHAALHLSSCQILALTECLKFPIRVEEDASVVNEDGLCLLPDTPDDATLIRSSLVTATPSLYLFQLSEGELHPGHWMSGSRRFHGCLGLVLLPGSDKEPNIFRRVGSFDFYRTRREVETQEDAEFGSFFDVKGRSITLASRQVFIDKHEKSLTRRGFDIYTARLTEIDDAGKPVVTSSQIFHNMAIGKWSFGIGLECVAVIKYGLTMESDGSIEQPLVIPPPSNRHELHSHCHREIYLQNHMPAIRNQVRIILVNNLRTMPDLAGAQAITKSSHQRSKHRIDPLADYWEWQVKHDSIRLPDSLVHEHINRFLAPIEITSPALVVSMDNFNFHLVQEACDVLGNKFELLTPEATGLHIHVGQGRDWIPLHDLRRIAGLCYAADGLLAQLHPERRRNNDECASNRLYSLLSRGVTARMLETTYGWHEGVEIPPLSAGVKRDEPKDYSPIDRLSVPHGSLSGYTQDPETLAKCPIPADLLEAYPNLENNRELPSIKTAVSELLSCTDVRTVGRLMMCDSTRLVPAYNFDQYTPEMYRLPNVKRTIEFRQAAGDLESSAAVWARVFTWFCEWACEADLGTYWDVILKCSAAQENGHTDPNYDALDLLVDLGLHAEAQFLQSDHLYREAKKVVPPKPSLPKLDRPYRRLPSCTGG